MYGHVLTETQWGGVGLVFLGLGGELYGKFSSSSSSSSSLRPDRSGNGEKGEKGEKMD